MKLICKVCGRQFDYPIEQMKHRHEELELGMVPPNYWRIEGSEDIPIRPLNSPFYFSKEGVWIKDESRNPTGSFKDRGMPNLIEEVIAHKKDTVATVSCGSGAVSLSNYAVWNNLHPIIFAHKNIPKEIKDRLNYYALVFYSEDFVASYEDFMKFCNSNDEVFCGFINTNASYILGLRSLSYEIIHQFGSAPDIIVIPCGSGANIVAQNLALHEMKKMGIIKKIPQICVVEIEGGNPIKQGFEQKDDRWLHMIDNPVDSKTILSNDTCFNYKPIYEIAMNGEAFFESVSDDEIDEYVSNNQSFSKKFDYTSLTAIVAAKRLAEKMEDKDIVAIMTCENRQGGA